MDFFDLSKDFERVHLKGGQTQGYVKADDEDFNASEIKVRSHKGRSYIKKYLQKERQELENLQTLKSSSNQFSVSSPELTSLGSFPDVNELQKDVLTQVYSEYYKSKPKEKKNLMISDCKTKILTMIENNEVTIITGPTGCGKTTQVPQYILDFHAEKNLHCNIIVTQPRRIAAISIPKRVCEERDWPLGTICGYKVGLKDFTSEDTRLTYVTVGVFLQMLVNSKHMNDFTHVILDEVHERDLNMDFSLLVVKKYLNTNSRNVKVILMSATADAARFAYYFEKPLMGEYQPAPVINIGRCTNYTVQIHYLEEMAPLGNLPKISMEEPSISEEGMMTCIKLIKQFEKLDKSTKTKKSVLVFLPGIYEIEELFNRLKDPKMYAPGPTEYKWYPLALHSSVTSDEQAQVFLPPPNGYRKIILATNIAESSITVPDVMFVIDFCLTKVLMTHSKSNFTSLQLCWASKANCIQRAGRAGRVMEGRVYRMVYKEFYDKLDDQCIPDMLRCPLDKIVLQSKLLSIGSPKAVLALALDPPDLTNIERTILILKECGGLLLTRKGVLKHHDGDITYLGRLMALMPVDIKITRLIVLGHLFSVLEECIIMGAAMSLKSIFSSPFQAKIKSYNSKLDWADGSCSDCIAFLNVYDVWKMNHSNGYFKRSVGYGELEWAKRHFIQIRALREVNLLVEELKGRLKTFNIEPSAGVGKVLWNDVQKPFVLKFVIAGAFYPNYFGRGERGGQVDEKEAVKILGGKNPFTTVYLKNFPQNQPPDLYSHQIKEKMIECKEDMKISYDNSSKVFIEFRKQEFKRDKEDMPFNSEVPGKINMAVYRAVKMRHALKYIDIKTLPPDQARKKAEKMGLEARKVSLLNQTPNETSKDKLFQCLLPGIDVNCIPIHITYAVDPGHFWAANRDEINEQQSNDIFVKLNQPNAEFEAYSKPPEVGEMCIAPYEDEESGETWLYRGRVDAIRKEENTTVAQIYFIDYGNTETVPVSSLRKYGSEMYETLGKIPAQAFECVLTKIKASVIKNTSGKWTESAKQAFNNLMKRGDLIGSIYSVVDGVVSLVLHVVNVDKVNRQINVNEYLVREGFGEEIEESYLSKSNNELRRQRQLDCGQKSAYNSLHLHEEWLGTSLKPFDLEDCKMKLQLTGPYSPLEMKIFSCIRGGISKQIIISYDSVNSVLLDTDPQDPHERLVVAAHVSQNQSGTAFILNQTTIMPNIHGLAALVPFVFAPVVELRVNDKRTRYTGILCGLGADPSGEAIFPEHDMEVIFDCEFTFEDFSTINWMRFFMSLMLLSEGEDIHPLHSHPDVISFQNNIKNALMKLIDQHRPSKDLEFPRKEFTWKLVESDLTVTNETAQSYSRLSIFPLHPGVTINPNPNEKKKLKIHLENLKKMAEARVGTHIECQLCNIWLTNVNFLRLHLNSNEHKEKEEKLFKSGT